MKKGAFRVKQTIKMLSQHVYLPAVYNLHRLQKPEAGLILFADAHHESRPAALDLLYRKLAGREESSASGDGRGRSAQDDSRGWKPDADWQADGGRFGQALRIAELYLDFGRASQAQVLAFSTRFMTLYAKASVVVICDNFLPVASCLKKKETLVVQLWHACGAYKKFGYDAPDDIPRGYKGDVFRNMDLITVSAPAAVGPFSSAMHKRQGQVRAIGVSRTDLYFSEAWRRRCTDQFRERYPQAYGPEGKKRKKVVLWAPTFRGNAGSSELLNLDLDRLRAALGEDCLLLARLHPHMQAQLQVQRQKGSGVGRFLCPISTEELYPVTDVLIADYSSLLYEYLLVRRILRKGTEGELADGRKSGQAGSSGREAPEQAGCGLVLYVPDLGEYRKRRGFYMDPEEIPGRIVTEESRLAEAVRAEVAGAGTDETEPGDAFRNPKKSGSHREFGGRLDVFLDKYLSACDGHATERIARLIRAHAKERNGGEV